MAVKHNTVAGSIYLTRAAILRQERIAKLIAEDSEYQSHQARLEQLAQAKESNKPKPIDRRRRFGAVVPVNHQGTNSEVTSKSLANRVTSREPDKRALGETFVKRPRSVPTRRSIASTVKSRKPPPVRRDGFPKSPLPTPIPIQSYQPPILEQDEPDEDEFYPQKEKYDYKENIASDEEPEEEKYDDSNKPTSEDQDDPEYEKDQDHLDDHERSKKRDDYPDDEKDDGEDDDDYPSRDLTNEDPEVEEDDNETEMDISPTNTENAARLLKSYSQKERLLGATEARKDLSVPNNPPIQEYIDAGTVPLLIKGLSSDNNEMVMECAWALTNIASGSSHQTQTVINEGAVPHLVIGLSNKSEDVADQCVWALGNIAGDGAAYKQEVINVGGVKSLTNLVKPNAKVKYLRNLSWTLSNLFRKNPTKIKNEELDMILDKLKLLLKNSDEEVLRDTYWTLAYIADDPKRADRLIEKGFVPILVSRLKNSNNKLLVPVLRAIGNLASGSDEQTESIINGGALPEILKIMTNRAKLNIRVRKDATWILGNVLAAKPSLVKAAVDEGSLPAILNVINNDTDSDILKEAGWCIANLTTDGQQKLLDKAVMMDLPRGMTKILFHFTNDPAFKTVCLEALLQLFTGTTKKSDCYKSMFHDRSEDDFDVFVDSYEPSDKKAKVQATALLDKVSVFKIHELKDQKVPSY